MSKGIVEKDRGWNRIKKDYATLSRASLKVGLQAGDVDDSGVPIATYGFYNEFGTERIPERSFIRSTADEQRENWNRLLDAAYQKIIDGKITPRKALAIVGTKAQQDIQKKIVDGPFQENSDATKERKNSNRPLIDTSLMRQSVRWVLEGI